jgi:hypothetical protein
MHRLTIIGEFCGGEPKYLTRGIRFYTFYVSPRVCLRSHCSFESLYIETDGTINGVQGYKAGRGGVVKDNCPNN